MEYLPGKVVAVDFTQDGNFPSAVVLVFKYISLNRAIKLPLRDSNRSSIFFDVFPMLAVSLTQEIILDCRRDGEQDYKDGKPFHKERSSACGEFGDPYRDGYEYRCQQNYTESHCTLLIEEEKRFCPDHPDIA